MCACQVARPWFITGLVKRIAFGTHLKEDGIDATLLERIKLVGEHLTNLSWALTQILPVDTLNPGTSKFALGIGGKRNEKRETTNEK